MAASFSAGWRQVVACLLLVSACGMTGATYSIVAVPFGEEFQPSRMVLMLPMTVMAASTAILSPVLGNLLDQLSLRIMMAIGAGLMVFGFFALSFATSFNHVLAIYGIFMAPAAILIGPMATTVLLSRWFVKRRGAALGIAFSGIGVGGFIFPFIIQGLLDSYDWRDAMRLLALILFVALLPALVLIVNRPSDRGLHPDGAQSDPEEMSAATQAAPLSAWSILSDPTFWLASLMFGIVLSGMKGMITNLVPLAIDEGIGASIAAPLISIYAASLVVSKLSFAGIADRLNPRVLILLSLAGFILGMACMIFASSGYWVIALGVTLIGLFGGLMIPLQSFLIPRIFGPKVVGKASGLLHVVTLLALLSTPPLFGLFFDKTGNYNGIFIVFVGLSIATAVMIVPALRLSPRIVSPKEVDIPVPAK